MSSTPLLGPSRARWSQVALISAHLLVTNGVILMPPVLYSQIAAISHARPDDVAALWPACFSVANLLTALPAGLVMERLGVSRCVVVGTVGICAGTLVQPFLTSLWAFAAAQALLGMSHSLGGTISYIALCSMWFATHKATAIALTFSAFAVAGLIWPPLAAQLATHFGCRVALAVLAGVQLLIALPVAILGISDPPTSAYVDEAASASLGWQLSRSAQWLRDWRVWHLKLMSFTAMFVVFGLNNSLIIFLNRDAGLPLPTASLSWMQMRAWSSLAISSER
mmetsp:Transcript_7595/g.17751  ORF Transcript_7595/g.17751 Transcript_7595/m.17751 type:complete len:281 (-) Transcript_7595:618-1460(-)